MAGSYNHCVTNKGKLRAPKDLLGMLDAMPCGDVYEAIEEMYGMIWLLAGQLAHITREETASHVEEARQNYKRGLDLSPGVKK
jgi:hypothetical protein